MDQADQEGPPMSEDPAAGAAITRTVRLYVRLPQVKPTERVEIREITIPPGRATGLHVHNGPVVGSITAGSAVYQIEGEEESVLRPGDVFYEPEGVRIARFDAEGDGVTFLAHFLLAPGQDAEMVFPDE
jgi:quercetin dioxygenase-like cupin family protein